MTLAGQLTLDAYLFELTHQVGQIRMPWTTADGRQVGDLIPAWRCCACGGIELSEYALRTEHGCCGAGWIPRCQNPPRPPGPYRMDAHWIPPEVAR